MHTQAVQNFNLLRDQLKTLPADIVPLAQQVLDREPAVISRFRQLYEREITAWRIRCHGDYHLGQVLRAGGDFVIIDFEGEPALPLPERRIKRSPLRDVAGMVRSFDYAAWTALYEYLQRSRLGRESLPRFEPWLRGWYQAVSSVFLRAYRETLGESDIVPRSEGELSAMLPAYLLNKAVYEVGYELNNRPFWLRIPLLGILEMFASETKP
jgi:maltose alpha-D-glucosyltransferase/alpha-amylase